MDTKQKLMLATLQLIAQRGYEGVSIDDIAAKTNNTKGAAYHYFDSKSALYQEALEFLAVYLTSLATVEISPRTSTAEIVKQILATLLPGEFSADAGLAPADVYYLYFDGMRRFPDLKARFQVLTRSYLASILAELRQKLPQQAGEYQEMEALQVLIWLEGISLIQEVTGGLLEQQDIDGLVDRFFA